MKNQKGSTHLLLLIPIALVVAGTFFFLLNSKKIPEIKIPFATPSPGTNSVQQDIPENYMISLQFGKFDTRYGEPDIPESLRIDSYPQGVDGYYIVQFDGIILPEWTETLETAVVRKFGYIPNNAFLVSMANDDVSKVSRLEHVQWIGIFQPAYRIRPHLINLPNERITLTIMTFPDTGLDQLVSQLEDWGGKVEASFEGELAGRVRVEIDSTYIEQIARHNGVMWIERWTQPVLY